MVTNPISWFFSLGDRVTHDVKQKAEWDFWLLVIMFLAFFTILVDNLLLFFNTQRFYNLGWSFVMLAILYFQYFGLKQAYEFRKMLKAEKPNEKVESEEDMLKAFNSEIKEIKNSNNETELEEIIKQIDQKSKELDDLFEKQSKLLDAKNELKGGETQNEEIKDTE